MSNLYLPNDCLTQRETIFGLPSNIITDIITVSSLILIKIYRGTIPGNGKAKKKNPGAQTAGILSELAYGQDMAYVEQKRSKNKDLKLLQEDAERSGQAEYEAC